MQHLPNGKDTAFLFRTNPKNTKTRFVLFDCNFFSKKTKKTLARKKISCTFAAAFGNG